MTASQDGAVSVPNAALRFDPSVVQEQRGPRMPGPFGRLMNDEPRRAPADNDRKSGPQVWTIEGGTPRPVTVTAGISDGRRTEIVAGNLKAGDRVITGTQMPAP